MNKVFSKVEGNNYCSSCSNIACISTDVLRGNEENEYLCYECANRAVGELITLLRDYENRSTLVKSRD